MSVKAPFTVEYAKSGKSKCKKCEEPIAQATARIGKLERSKFFDGEIYEWRHQDCFFSLFTVKAGELKGLTDLKWDDQQALAAKCSDKGGGVVGGTGGAMDESEECNWVTELARSNRSTCRGCATKIELKELRVGKEIVDEDMGYTSKHWYHVACVMLPSNIKDPKDIDGYSGLNAANKKLIQAQMKSLSKKRKGDDKEQQAAAKKAKKEAETLWATKEQLEKDYSKDELRAILKLTEQSCKGGPPEILNRVADCKLLGALPACPECESKNLTRVADQVVCEGNISEWSKCTFAVPREAKGIKRTTWKMPDKEDIEEEVGAHKARKKQEQKEKKEMIAAAMGGSPAKPKARKKEAASGDRWAGQSVKELKAELKERGLPVSGKRADLVGRLQEDDGDEGGEEEEKEEAPAPKKALAKPPAKMGIKDLKAELAERGLSTKGKKSELAARLQEDEDKAAAGAGGNKAAAKPKVDERSGYTGSTAEVMTNNTGFPFAAVLTKADMGVGHLGVNSFYKTQCLRVGTKGAVYNHWGRVGEEGEKVTKEFNTPEKAMAWFVKNFYEKTGNSWVDFASGNFEKKAMRFMPVDVEEGGEGEDDAPLGRLTKDQIVLGQAVLARIEKELEGKSRPAQLKDMSSEFFSKIPTDFGGSKPVPISTLDMLHAKEELLKFYLRMGFEDMEEDKKLTPIGGVMDIPLLSLQNASKDIAPSDEIKRCLNKGGELETRQAGKPTKQMNADLYGSILLYTGNAIYSALNAALRAEDRKGVKKYFKYLRVLLESFDYLPSQSGKLWRGISVDLYDQYKVGSTITWWSVSSTTSDEQVARNFCGGCGGKCTLITLEAKTAMDIAALSFYASEKESLLAPGTQLKVISSKRNGNVTEIHMKEVGRALE